MLNGKLYLSDNPPWLNELIPINGEYFVPYPPLPAILALPFVLLSKNFEQQFLAHILGAGTAIAAGFTAFNVAGRKNHFWYLFLFAGFGNVLWFLSAGGSSWYLGQVSAAFFLMAAIYTATTNKNPFITGLLIGAAYLSRVHTILSLIFFITMLVKKPVINKDNFIKLTVMLFGVAPFLVFNALYNFARFGVLYDAGYALIPGVLDEPWYTLGLVHPSYITRHFDVLVKALPVVKDQFPYIYPSWGGLAIWITSPAIFISFLAPLKAKVVRYSWVAIALISIPILTHGTNGFAQFGYRFIVDVIPFFFLIMAHALKKKINTWQWVLLVISIAVNAWGVLWIYKFGWVV